MSKMWRYRYSVENVTYSATQCSLKFSRYIVVYVQLSSSRWRCHSTPVLSLALLNHAELSRKEVLYIWGEKTIAARLTNTKGQGQAI